MINKPSEIKQRKHIIKVFFITNFLIDFQAKKYLKITSEKQKK